MNQRSFIDFVAALAATVGLASCTEVVAPAAQPARSGVTALLAADTGTADGVSLTTVTAVVDSTLPVSQRAVTINTTVGVFTFGGKQTVVLLPDSAGRASAYLQAPRDSGVALITASAGSATGAVSRSRTLSFRRARAEAMTVVPDSFSLGAGITRATRITARLLRAVGKPSPQIGVTFVAADSLSSPRGQFSVALPSDSAGLVVVQYSSARFAADTLYRGPVTVTARVVRDTAVFGRATIIIR